MASETEGIALLSMYNDEEEDEEEQQQELHHYQQRRVSDDDGGDRAPTDQEPDEAAQDSIAPEHLPDSIPSKSPQNLCSPSPELKSLRSPMPPPWLKSQRSSPLSLPSPSPTPPFPRSPPPPPAEPVGDQKGRREALAIVDYGHDEAAMSPDAEEEGEIARSGLVEVGMEVQNSFVSIRIFKERTPPRTVQLSMPNTQPECSQPSDLPEVSRFQTSMAIDSIGSEPGIAQAEITRLVFAEVQVDDQLKSFLPLPATTKCPGELQEKINKFLAYKKAGKSFNEALRNRKDYRNPDFLRHAVTYQCIDKIGTCFSKGIFDPHGYDKSDYFDEIEADMKWEIERKEQERKKSQKIDFIPGGTQPGTVPPAPKISTQIPVSGISASVTSGSASTAPDVTRESRQKKKSKWDKIDGDLMNLAHSGGHDNLSSVGVHAAHLSVANAGSGYTAFVYFLDMLHAL